MMLAVEAKSAQGAVAAYDPGRFTQLYDEHRSILGT